MTKDDRRSQWAARKEKHVKDYVHVPGGFVGGNRRYKRTKADHRNNMTMGRASECRS